MTTHPEPIAIVPAAAKRGPPKVLFDWRDWLPFLEHFDAPESQKRELIETYWAIILTFVDLGWEVGSSAPEETSGQVGEVLDLAAALRATMVQSEEQTPTSKPSSREAVGQESEEV